MQTNIITILKKLEKIVFFLTRFIILRVLCKIYTINIDIARAKRLRNICSSLFIASYLLFIILRKFFIREFYKFAFLFSFLFFLSPSNLVNSN